MSILHEIPKAVKVRKQGSGPIGPPLVDGSLAGAASLSGVGRESERPWACAEGLTFGSGFRPPMVPSASSIGQGSAAVKSPQGAASVHPLSCRPDPMLVAACPPLATRLRNLPLLPWHPLGADRKEARGGVRAAASGLSLTTEKHNPLGRLAHAYDLLGRGNAAARVRDCGHKSVVYTCLTTGKRWRRAWHCHDRNCPRCSATRASRLFHKHREKVRRPGLKMLTLTVPSVKYLTRGYVRRLLHQVSLLLHRKVFREAWVGGFYGIETTWNARHGFHVHAHVLLEGSFVPWADIRRNWLEITGNGKVVWIQAARNPGQAFKYPLKPDALRSMPVGHLAAYLEAVRCLPLAQPFGSWHASFKGDAGPDDEGLDVKGDDVADDGARDDVVRLACPYCGECEYTRDVLPGGADVSGIPLAHEDWQAGVWILDL